MAEATYQLDAEDGRLLDAVRGLRWQAGRPPRQMSSGAHLSRNLGPSAELSDYRPYRQGDEVRRIDWKLLARTDRAYIRLAQDHSRTATMFCVDASASMAWPVDSLGKWHQARQITLGLAAAARAAGDPVGLAVTGGASDIMLPMEGRPGTVHTIAQLLRGITPGGSAALNLPHAPLAQHRLVLIGDFLSDESDIAGQVALTGEIVDRGGEVLAIHVVADEELAPERKARALFDVEDPTRRRNLDSAGLAEYRDRFGAWRTDLAQRFRRRGANFTVAQTSEPPAVVVQRIVKGLM